MRRFFLVLFIMLLALPAWADGHDADPLRQIKVLPAIINNNDGTVTSGLSVQLRDHWKTYWRAPGIAGEAMRVSSDDHTVEIIWPAPKRFNVQGIETIGYDGDILFPLRITPDAKSDFNLTIDLIVCDKLCVPLHKILHAVLNQKRNDPAAEILLQKALRDAPQNNDHSDIAVQHATLQQQGKEWRIAIDGTGLTRDARPDVFLDTGIALDLARPVFTFNAQGWSVVVAIKDRTIDSKQLLSKPWRVTITSDQGNAEQSVQPVFKTDTVWSSLVWMAIAFLGGVLLNIMPCVLPVLALKLLSVTRQAGAARAAIRRGFLETAAGIVASFLMLAVCVIAIKQVGFEVGWGIQFQQPVFLIVMIVLLCVFAADLFGVFAWSLPQSVLQKLPSKTVHPFWRHFFDGVLATVLATPCTAPLVGTAAGFALAGSSRDIVMIFTAMGFGFALPYFMVALLPGMIGLLPKPGRWMGVFKKAMALCLLVTAYWLGTVLYKTQNARAHSALWQDWSEDRLQQSIATGQTVFVDITADWCLTCKVNELAVLSRPGTLKFFADHHVILLRADWTQRDDRIARYLHRMRRAGIPFNAVYGAHAKDGIVLGEILTTSDIKAAVQNAE